MVISCSAYACNEYFVKGGSITFHSFPKDEQRKKQWEVKLKRENFVSTKYTKICSKHFEEECFDKEKFGGTWLKKDAVPTIFDFPEHLQKRTTDRKMHKFRVTDFEAGTSTDTSKGEKRKFYLGDFDEYDMTSPSKAKKMLCIAQDYATVSKKKIKHLTQKATRLKRRVTSLEDMLSEMKKKSLISDPASRVLELSLPGSAIELIKRVEKGASREKYPPQLRAFALTLHFYSAKAYSYVRKTFNTNLPHPTTLRKWYQCVNGSPGYTSEAFTALTVKANEAKQKNQTIKCGLIMDEMAIRSHVEWDKDKFSGYVDLGTNLDDDQMPKAKEALVFMVNALNGNWKIPVAYFLVNGLNSSEKSNLVKETLRLIHDTGVDIVSLTFDGTSTNVATANVLGANISSNNLEFKFPHPITKSNIVVILDPCHMLKLVRNTLATKGCLFDKDGGIIKWDFVKKLEKLQDSEELHAATKIRKRHIQWQREKMKVKLAAQVLSQSVADALSYLGNDLKLPEFEGCDPTVNFFKIFNNLFDVLNSKNLLSKGFKSPMQFKNKTKFINFLNEVELYITGLKMSRDGDPILVSNRKMGFLGFLICIKSVKSLYFSLCEGNEPNMKFILTYKLSQDHLEMFFSAIRSKGGHNNNPTAKQFKSAYVCLLCHHEIMTSDNANCLALDETNILNVASSNNSYAKNIKKISFNLDDDLEDMENAESVSKDHAYITSNNLRKLSEYVTDVVGYIAGFVVRKLYVSVKCEDCIVAITDISLTGRQNKLIQRKNRGGLITPSRDAVLICKNGEIAFRIAQATGKLTKKSIMHLLIAKTLQEIESNVFDCLSEHILDHVAIENHRLSLMKAILFEYFSIRLYHVGKRMTEQLQVDKIRSNNTKLTILKGQ